MESKLISSQIWNILNKMHNIPSLIHQCPDSVKTMSVLQCIALSPPAHTHTHTVGSDVTLCKYECLFIRCRTTDVGAPLAP